MNPIPTITAAALALSPLASAHSGPHHHPPDDGTPSPAEKKIEAAEKAVAESPDDASAYPPLAMAYAYRARELGDPSYYERGMDAVEKALELDPGDFAARKAGAWITLGDHEFREALEMTRALVAQKGDDPMLHAMRADAAIETGEYKEAEEAAQWALDLDPGGIPGLTRAAYLREHYGDFDGAIDLMKRAFNRTRATDSEDRAWLLTHIGHLLRLKNELEAAATTQKEALRLFPDYHYALANLARVRTAQGKPEAALELHRRHHDLVNSPDSLYGLATALRRADREQEADKAFAEFEKAALEKATGGDNSNHKLVDYYLAGADRPDEALRVAEIEMKKRRDFRTRRAYARALHATGAFEKAHAQMAKALETGVRYPEMQYHAGLIARDAGHPDRARRFFRRSINQAPNSAVAAEAEKALRSLERDPASTHPE